jgi:hypothetical protein
MQKLKKPIELVIYPKQLDGNGIYSIARLQSNELSAVIYHYETETWELLPRKWMKNIMSFEAIPVAEEILHLNGVGWIINNKFKNK